MPKSYKCTGGSRYPRVCYLRFWLSAVAFLWPEFGIRSFSLGYPRFLNQISFKTNQICNKWAPLVSAVLVFAGSFENVTPANNEGRLYCRVTTTIIAHLSFFDSLDVSCVVILPTRQAPWVWKMFTKIEETRSNDYQISQHYSHFCKIVISRIKQWFI